MVWAILMDQEFDKVKDKMPSVEVNTTAAREHAGEIERGIRLVKKDAEGLALLCRPSRYQNYL